MNALIPLVILCSMLVAHPAQATGASGIRDANVTLTDGTQIHILEAGQPSSAPAVVFIPGWTLPAFLWTSQMRRFSTDRLVIAIDPRSQGDSSKTENGNTPEQRARDLREILSNLGITSAVLVGWSQGANDVAAYVQQFGMHSIAGLVFVDSPVAAGPAEIEIHTEWSRRFLARLHSYVESPAAYSEGLVRSIFKQPHPDLDIESVIASSRKTPPNIGLSMLIMDIFGTDRRPALARIDRPTLVIPSAESPLLKAQKEMADATAGAQFVSVEGAGHALFVDQPRIFNEAFGRLLKAISSANTSKTPRSMAVPQ